jgi:hypothetical protein
VVAEEKGRDGAAAAHGKKAVAGRLVWIGQSRVRTSVPGRLAPTRHLRARERRYPTWPCLSLSLSFSLSQASAREEGQLVARPLPWPHALRRRGAIIMAAPNKLRFPSPPSSGTNSARLKSDLFSIH